MSAKQTLSLTDADGDQLLVEREGDQWSFMAVAGEGDLTVYVSDEDAQALIKFLNAGKSNPNVLPYHPPGARGGIQTSPTPGVLMNPESGLTPGGTCR